jgi:hypothetical protein
MEQMAKYIPLGFAVFLTALGITIEHSIVSMGVAETSFRWLSYGLEVFVFVIWTIGIFVIGATHKDFCQEDVLARPRQELDPTHAVGLLR